MSSEPCASAKRVFWIVENGSSHAGPRSLAARIAAFEDHYRQIAKPFEWTFARAKLAALLARLAAREPPLPLAA